MDYTRLSKEVSYALRHAPHEYGLELDDDGFVPVERLLGAINRRSDYGRPVTADDLRKAIRASDKRRHEMVGGMIRALYGHSTPKKIIRQPVRPLAVLYHGTARRFLGSILESGLKPMGRQYVHLSADVATARQVGGRHDAKPVILSVDAESAYERGVRFYRGNENVWLADEVPALYLRILE